MYVRIPPYIEILGIEYPVRFIEELPAGRVAQINFLDGEIQIQKTMGENVVFLSFLHEVTHGILQGMNYNMMEMIYHDEPFVERLAQGYAQVFKQILEYNMEPDYLREILADYDERLDAHLRKNEPPEEEEMPEFDITTNIPSLDEIL